MRALLLLLAVVGSASAFCEGPFTFRDYVFAKGHANVTLYDHKAVLKGLRIVLENFPSREESDGRPSVLATATTDDTGFYVIAGSHEYLCYAGNYSLQLYYDAVATYSLSAVEIPRSFVTRSFRPNTVLPQPVKVFEADITADYFPAPS